MHDVTTRPLDEAQRAFKAIFKRLLDTAHATTHLGFVSTTEGQIEAERLLVDRFNAEAKKAGWDVRLEQLGPALPDLLYKWDGQFFRPAPSGAAYAIISLAGAHGKHEAAERWRRLGLQSPAWVGQGPLLKLRHKSAMVKGRLIPAKQGPIISKPSDGIGWATEYRPVGGLRFFIGDIGTIRLKRGEWLSDTFAALWLQGEALSGAALWAAGSLRSPGAELPAYQRIFQREAGWRWDQRLRKRVFWQRLDNDAVLEANRFERAEGKRRDRLRKYIAAIDGGFEDNPGARAFNSRTGRHSKRPYRPHFWNVRDYSESALIRFKDGKYARVTRQYGGPILIIAVTLYLNALYLSLLAAMPLPATQRLLERWGRLYKSYCWSNYRFDGRSSAYLQVNETVERRQTTQYHRFDQRASVYLYPEHAPKPGWKQSNKVTYLGPLRDCAKLKRDWSAHNERYESYWSYPLDRGGSVGLSRRMRETGSLNIDLAARNNMMENLKHDFAPRREQKEAG